MNCGGWLFNAAVGPRWVLRSAEFTTSWLTFAPSAVLLEQGLNRLAAGLV
jgi:hypothetical protein